MQNMKQIDIVKIKITNRCNRACQFCVFHESPTQSTDLSLPAFAKMVDILRPVPLRRFHINGGEPLLHPDFTTMTELVEERLDPEIMVLGTNAVLLEQECVLAAFVREHYDEVCIGCDSEHRNIGAVEAVVPYLLSASRTLVVINSLVEYSDQLLLDRLDRLKALAPERIILVRNHVYHTASGQAIHKLQGLCRQEGKRYLMIQENGGCYRCFNAMVPDDGEFCIWDEDFYAKLAAGRTAHYKFCPWCRRYDKP